MTRQCAAFFRVGSRSSIPCCGNAYCLNVWNDEIDCPIKPSKNEPRVLRRETA